MFSPQSILWLVLLAVFLLVEGGTVALVSLWFALGALAALIVALAGGAGWLQVAVFLMVSGGLLAMLRPMLRRHVKLTKTNLDSIPGSQGLVTAAIDNLSSQGEVKLGAMTWTARSSDNSPIPVGTQIQVDRIEGVKVFVSRVEVPAATK